MSQRFISESDIQANKKQLKDAWDATRGEDDPQNPPEEPPPDHRTLFHRLEEQKLKKQEEYEDAHRLKNMVRGLEDEEVQFLDMVDRTKMEQERRVRDEESTALSEFRKRRVEMEIARTSEIVSTVSHTSSSASTNKTPKNSQKLLLSGAIKRKVETGGQSNESSKKCKTAPDDSGESQSPNEEQPPQSHPSAAQTQGSDSPEDKPPPNQNGGRSPESVGGGNATGGPISSTIGSNGYLKFAGVLPGLGQYSDSSDSANSSEESDPDTRPRFVIRNKSKKKGCC